MNAFSSLELQENAGHLNALKYLTSEDVDSITVFVCSLYGYNTVFDIDEAKYKSLVFVSGGKSPLPI